MKDFCEHPKLSENVDLFVRMIPRAKSLKSYRTVKVDPRTWFLANAMKYNTAVCCVICVLVEGVKRDNKDKYSDSGV